MVELATGLLFAATWLRYGLSIELFIYSAFIAALIIAFAVDLEHFIIPDQVSIAGVVLGIVRDIAHIVAGDFRPVRIPVPGTDIAIPMLPSVVGILVCGGMFFLVAYAGYYAFRPKDPVELETYEGALGGGDIKLAAAVGSVVGVVPALGSFLIAVIFGTLFGVGLIVLRSVREQNTLPWRTEIPFGPYMVAGAVMVILMEPQLRSLWQMWVGFVTGG